MFLLQMFILFYVPLISAKIDYYELLGISKTATNQEIRRAFKKIAVTSHPDKNQDDPDSHEKFIKITRAYEVLKDGEKRREYDLHGEEKSGEWQPEYHSYAYYRDHFGIYDEDPHIITLTLPDFESNVENSEGQWFVNFYSPMCSTCHKLAPSWRALAEQMNGAIYFGAVNCEEDWSLCRQQGVHSYPSLVLYPSNELVQGVPTKEKLEEFILKNLKTDIVLVESEKIWDEEKETHGIWLLMLASSSTIPKEYLIIAAMLRGLLGTAVIRCDKISCDEWTAEGDDRRVIYMSRSHEAWSTAPLSSLPDNPRDVLQEVLALLPDLERIDEAMFRDITRQLHLGSTVPWLIYFHLGPGTDLDQEVKKLPPLLSNFKIGRVNCGRYVNICQDLSISRYPLFGVFKTGGGWEFHHGSETALGVAGFAREAAAATNLRTVGEEEFFREIRGRGAWLVDFYAPWCPPCLRLLPQLRKASHSFTPSQIGFATVDCTVHQSLCAGQNVRAYPTTMLFNATRRPQSFRGQSAASIVEFLQDILRSYVMELSYDSFYETVGKKTEGTVWMVGYFMPWCGPCQQLAPHFRKLAKLMSEMERVHIAEVNCEVEMELCRERGVRSYPHIEVHPYQAVGPAPTQVFSGYQRDVQSLRRWLFSFLPSSVVELNPDSFSSLPEGPSAWLIDFYAPWCGHCVAFEPDFITIAQKLEGRVKCGKVNCEQWPGLCQTTGVSGYPTVKFFGGGGAGPRGIEVHSQNPQVILEFVDQLLSSETRARFTDEL